MNWNLRTLRTRILSRAEVVEHFVPVHSELEHKTVEHFDPEHKTAEHMDPGPLQKLPNIFTPKRQRLIFRKCLANRMHFHGIRIYPHEAEGFTSKCEICKH